MRVAGAESIVARGLRWASVVNDFAAPAADPLVMRAITSDSSVRMGLIESQIAMACRVQLPSKGRSYFQVAQRMRASLLASATVALL